MIVTPAMAQAPTRHALVIGNQAYGNKVGALKNPLNDIGLVGTALGAIGFRVTPRRDATRRQVLAAVRGHARALAAGGPNAIGFLYYSGHGVARPDTRANYLVPVDVADTATDDFWDDAVALDDILKELENGAPEAAHFIVFDACRNEIRLPGKSAAKGFAPVAERNGMFIAFAAAPDQQASDAGQGSGPYAAALAAELVRQGQHHLDLFQNVKEQVLKTTGQRQTPWERNGLTRRVYLAGAAASKLAARPIDQKALMPIEVVKAWEATKNSTSVAILEAFARHYPETVFAAQANARILELNSERKVKIEAKRALQPKTAGLASAKSNAGAAQDCRLIQSSLSTPIALQVGTQLCSEDGTNRVRITRITEDAVGFAIGSKLDHCQPSQQCAFSWSGSPRFRVVIERASNAAGAVASARLIPW